jgi:hypothetical protein
MMERADTLEERRAFEVGGGLAQRINQESKLAAIPVDQLVVAR